MKGVVRSKIRHENEIILLCFETFMSKRKWLILALHDLDLDSSKQKKTEGEKAVGYNGLNLDWPRPLA